MLTNVLAISEQEDISFNDVSKDAWYYSSVAKAYKAGWQREKEMICLFPRQQLPDKRWQL
ncbi:hypothetical protein N752_00145 [Desulforamulus aquiferis]|nr:hypothetical protein [Desulforamulus aquiferis]RYD07024.1 hypothetical protein N752_00145 [Desulforamulus aquiferis]